jgi:hypothetical protein
VSALVGGPIEPERWAAAAGWPDDEPRAARVVASLVAHGLAVRGADGVLRLPS